MTIRQMTQADIEEIDKIEQKCFSVPWSRESFEHALNIPEQLFLVSEEDGKLSGYVGMWCVLDEGQILNVAVAPDYRRQGIARRLMNELLKIGRERGMHMFSLEVRESNIPAQRLYEQLGFKTVGLRKNYYTMPTEAAVLMDYVPDL